jgi:hypothetical protein
MEDKKTLVAQSLLGVITIDEMVKLLANKSVSNFLEVIAEADLTLYCSTGEYNYGDRIKDYMKTIIDNCLNPYHAVQIMSQVDVYEFLELLKKHNVSMWR